MYILGIDSFYHDSAACILKDGVVVAAVEEERFSRLKHDNEFPIQAVQFCLKKANISIDDIDYISYYEKPLLRFERVMDTFVQTFPYSLRPFLKGIPEWMGQKIKVENIIRSKLSYKGKIFYIPHHISHASASFFPSNFSESAILTIDGVGEYQTTGLWVGKDNRITPLKKIDFPHSIGLLYSTFTAFLGFRVNEDEYKVMGLAAYGQPKYKKDIYRIVDVKEDGSFQLNMNYFSYRESFSMWNARFIDLFGKQRLPNENVSQHQKDIAASIQVVTEEIYFKILNHLYELTKSKNLCVGGGVGLNALANGKIYKNTLFKNVYIIGPAGDGGSALGSALFTYQHVLGKKRRSFIKNLYLGSEYSDDSIETLLKKNNIHYQKYSSKEELVKKTARLLKDNHIIGWFQGKMEYGPRALGARSILANPKDRRMKDKVNRIKIRELFRPFAGSVLQEKVNDYFEVPKKNYFSPFMNFCFAVKKEKRSDIAAIVHEDSTCRIQTVSKDDGIYYDLINEFYKLTKLPVVLNTSFNLKGEPIVETPKQAIEDFIKTKMDYLVIGSFISSKLTRRE